MEGAVKGFDDALGEWEVQVEELREGDIRRRQRLHELDR